MQRKIKRKFLSLMLAASLAGSSLASLPMNNVFAGTGKNGVIKAPKAKKVTEIFIFGYPANNIIDVGKNFTLTADFFPPGAYAAYKTVEWSSSDETIATVTSDGKVTANKAGTVTITATAKNGSTDDQDWITNDVNITVLQPVTGFSISGAPTNNKIDVGKDFTLTAGTFAPDNAHADYKKVEWSSDKPAVATVDKDTGKVSAKSAGTVTITATAKNGSENESDWVTKSVEITVLQPVTGIAIGNAPANNTMDVGKTHNLTATLSPENVSQAYKTVTWESNNTGVATVNENGTVTAVAAGEATITATAKNGLGEDKSGEWIETSVEITVRPPASSITLNKSTLAISVNQTETLQATVLPQGADQTVTWSSDKPDVAEVDENGKVTAKALGEATITATTPNDLSASCKVDVDVDVDVVVVKANQTPYNGGYVQDDIVVDPVKLTFSAKYINILNHDGWCRNTWGGNFTLTVVPADGSHITITQCKFYHEDSGQSSTSTGPTNFSCEAFQNGSYYGITKVDVYFIRNN